MELTEEILRQDYTINMLTDSELAVKYDISASSIRNKRKKFNIETLTPLFKLSQEAENNGLLRLDAIEKEKLTEMVLEFGKCGIKDKFGCSQETIDKMLKSHNISIKKTHKDISFTKDDLKEMYEVKHLSDREIGQVYNVTDVAISYYRKKYGIKTIKVVDRIVKQAEKNGLRNINLVTKKEFEELYQMNGCRDMAKLFGCSSFLVNTKLQEFGISALQKSDRNNINLPSKLTINQESVLIGSLLGDGYMGSDNGRTARFKEMHCERQKDYLYWKKHILKRFVSGLADDNKTLADGRVCKGFSFRTYYSSLFIDFHKSFYTNGVKHFPWGIKDKINELSLAVWYQDDGSLKGCKPIISTCFEDVEEIAEFLREEFSIEIEVRNYELGTLVFEPNRFFEIVRDYIHPVMQYKIPLSFRLGEAGLLHLEDVKFDNTVPVEDIVKYWRIRGFPYPYYNTKQRMIEIKKTVNSKYTLEDEIVNISSSGSGYCISNFKHFWNCKRYRERSPSEVFDNDLQHVVEDTLKFKKHVTASKLRSELQTFGGLHNFKPVLAKAIYDEYCKMGGTVLDPCAGWGGRLFGYYCSGTPNHYIGVDANPNTVKSLKHMRTILDRTFNKSSDIYYGCFNDTIIKQEVDVVFTSPPYYNKEDYGTDDNQSIVKYSSYYEWFDGFLKPLINKSYSLLKNNGYMLFNMANIKIGKKEYKIADDLECYLRNNYNLVKIHKMIYKGMYGNNGKFEPIFVCKK